MTIDGPSFWDNVAPDGVGAAIDNGEDGTLTVTNSVFHHNSAHKEGGAINNAGEMTISASTFEYNHTKKQGGGGIYNTSDGTMTIHDSSFISNTAGGKNDGGALYNKGVAAIVNTTVVAADDADGGGIQNKGTENDTVQVAAARLAEDALGSGPVLCLRHVTLAGVPGSDPSSAILQNGVDATLHLLNSLIASGACLNAGHIGFNRHNLVEDGSCAENSVNQVTGPALLGPLQNNGGSTPTLDLLPGSPAIDSAEFFSCLERDQRGFSRPHGRNCDISAVESQPMPHLYLPIVAR